MAHPNKRWKARRTGLSLNINPESLDDFRAHINTLPFNTQLAVTVTRWQRRTSNPQLAYYFGVVVELLSEHTGFTKEEMDFLLKNRFVYSYVNVNGVTLKKVLSKTTTSTARFEEFLETTRRWAEADLGVLIPLPNEAEIND